MRRRPRHARPEHHTNDPVYWSRVSARHARAAVRHAQNAERHAGRARNAAIIGAALMLVFVVWIVVRVLA